MASLWKLDRLRWRYNEGAPTPNGCTPALWATVCKQNARDLLGQLDASVLIFLVKLAYEGLHMFANGV